ncbi:metallothionein 20-I isoforms A and B-like [Drosophila busckii]|uniref:metallothionein 20-I isoforms A and B-like n=1 Tax=Drosophila busckii TaxID=30019 RepID=UPI00083EB0F5|nr:metallothionein 20-I isoforms A and B-like [Drosophila busckii]
MFNLKFLLLLSVICFVTQETIVAASERNCNCANACSRCSCAKCPECERCCKCLSACRCDCRS